MHLRLEGLEIRFLHRDLDGECSIGLWNLDVEQLQSVITSRNQSQSVAITHLWNLDVEQLQDSHSLLSQPVLGAVGDCNQRLDGAILGDEASCGRISRQIAQRGSCIALGLRLALEQQDQRRDRGGFGHRLAEQRLRGQPPQRTRGMLLRTEDNERHSEGNQRP